VNAENGTPPPQPPAVSVVTTVGQLKALVGQDLGAGPWHLVTQQQVDAFADLTGDHQYIHIDTERARQTPYGGTIAHGYFTLSLLPALTLEREGIRVDLGGRMRVNYGLNRLRFPAPVPVGRRIRARTRLLAVEEVAEPGAPTPGGSSPGASTLVGEGQRAAGAGRPPVQITWQHTVEVEGSEKPALVAEAITRFYF
jgi:acyl dehydratase